MDCVTFRRSINRYMQFELSDEELNDFLAHLKSCHECRDELEINYIVIEGMNILDEDRSDYDLTKAYAASIREAERYIGFRKFLLCLRYIVGTVTFWAVALTFYVFFFDHSGILGL